MRILAALLLMAGLGCTSGPASREEPSPTPTAAPDTLGGAAALPDSLSHAHELVATLELQALGNEPFWSVQITRDAIVYSDPEHQGAGSIRFPYAQPSGRAGGLVFETSRPDSSPRSLRVLIHTRECSDGMSDLRYLYTSQVRLDSLELRGCARFRPLRVTR